MAQSLVEQIIGGIADVEQVEPSQLDISLQNFVSTDAISGLVDHKRDSWRLQFETPNHVIEVTGNDEILVDGTPTRTLE